MNWSRKSAQMEAGTLKQWISRFMFSPKLLVLVCYTIFFVLRAFCPPVINEISLCFFCIKVFAFWRGATSTALTFRLHHPRSKLLQSVVSAGTITSHLNVLNCLDCVAALSLCVWFVLLSSCSAIRPAIAPVPAAGTSLVPATAPASTSPPNAASDPVAISASAPATISPTESFPMLLPHNATQAQLLNKINELTNRLNEQSTQLQAQKKTIQHLLLSPPQSVAEKGVKSTQVNKALGINGKILMMKEAIEQALAEKAKEVEEKAGKSKRKRKSQDQDQDQGEDEEEPKPKKQKSTSKKKTTKTQKKKTPLKKSTLASASPPAAATTTLPSSLPPTATTTSALPFASPPVATTALASLASYLASVAPPATTSALPFASPPAAATTTALAPSSLPPASATTTALMVNQTHEMQVEEGSKSTFCARPRRAAAINNRHITQK